METATLAASLRPPKCPKLDWNSCLCHLRPSETSKSEPLTAFGDRSWKALFHGAGVQNDKTYTFLLENGADPAFLEEFTTDPATRRTHTSSI